MSEPSNKKPFATLQLADISIVEHVGGPVVPTDVDTYVKVKDAEERLERLRSLVAAWTEQQREERAMRRVYAGVLIGLMALEIVAVFVAFFLVAVGKLRADQWMAEAFLITALGQSSGMVLIVLKYLFPDRSSDLLRLVEASIGSGRDQKG